MSLMLPVIASVPSTGEMFLGQADHGLILMEDKRHHRCAVKVPEPDQDGYSTAVIHCQDGRTGLLKLRIDEEGIGVGYGSIAGHALSLTLGPG